MARNFRLWQNMQPILLLAPATDAAGRTSSYFSLRGAHKATIMACLTQGNAATVTFTPLQASAVAGTGSKAISAACPVGGSSA